MPSPRPAWISWRAIAATALTCVLFAPAAMAQIDGAPVVNLGGVRRAPARHAAPATADGPALAMRADVEALRAEVELLREQVRALTSIVRDTRGPEASAASTIPLSPAQVPPAANPDAERSRPPVRVTGTILSTSTFNSSDANWIDAPNVVGTAPGGSFTSSLRQSRLGVAIDPFAAGAWQASGRLELDFFGGTPAVATGSAMPVPRLVTAMARVERGSHAFAAGHDQVLFAPRDPTSLAALAAPQFYRAGNLFLRAPQLRVEQRLKGGLRVAGALVAPVAGDAVPTYTFAPPAGAGERAQRPALEARAAYAAGAPAGERDVEIGVSGHLGWLRQTGQHFANGGLALDASARVGRLGLAGELFTTDDLDAFGAGIAQPGRAHGGWLELRGAVLPRLSLTGGAGLDRRPDGAGTAGRTRNASAFGALIVQMAPAVSASLEYRWLQTRYVSGRDRVNHHVVAAMALRF